MSNTLIRSASVLVHFFASWLVYAAYTAGAAYQPCTDDIARIKKRFTGANITQEASASG